MLVRESFSSFHLLECSEFPSFGQIVMHSCSARVGSGQEKDRVLYPEASLPLPGRALRACHSMIDYFLVQIMLFVIFRCLILAIAEDDVNFSEVIAPLYGFPTSVTLSCPPCPTSGRHEGTEQYPK